MPRFPKLRLWSAMAAAVLLAASCSAPRPSPAALLATLPQEADGTQLDFVQIVDDSFLSGHSVDPVLAALGKSRSDASAVFRISLTSQMLVGAVAVTGVNGTELLQAVTEAWNSAAIIRRSEAVIQGKPVVVLDVRGGERTAAYARGSVVYLVSSDSGEVVEALLAAMP